VTQDAFERRDWQAVLDAHRMESHDAAEWLRYGSALLHTLELGPEAGKQQQQAGLAFVQAQRIGASAGAVAAAQKQVVLANLRQALELVGVPGPAEPEPHVALQRVLLVLGMHRSGTSALAGLLCQQGFEAPQNTDGGDANNPTGYWEPQRIRAFHNSLLEGAQSSWEDPLLPVLPWQPQNLMASLADLEQALADDFPAADSQAVALIKDPRQCRLLPLWTALFEQRPYQVAVVLAVRQPEAVAASLVKRDQLPLDRALLLWLSHTLEAERATRQLPRRVLSYEQLLQDPAAAVQRCQQLAGLPITTPSAELLGEWIRPGLNHHQRSPGGLERKGEGKTLCCNGPTRCTQPWWSQRPHSSVSCCTGPRRWCKKSCRPCWSSCRRVGRRCCWWARWREQRESSRSGCSISGLSGRWWKSPLSYCKNRRRCGCRCYRAGTGKSCASWPAPLGCTPIAGWKRRAGW
jgi:hypothetical protein